VQRAGHPAQGLREVPKSLVDPCLLGHHASALDRIVCELTARAAVGVGRLVGQPDDEPRVTELLQHAAQLDRRHHPAWTPP
jgi:hypothetical protein